MTDFEETAETPCLPLVPVQRLRRTRAPSNRPSMRNSAPTRPHLGDVLTTRLARLDVAELLSWYQHKKRDFPWRRDPDPYKVWVCEVMSQQTTLAVVLPYFERFIEVLPDCEALASCPDETLRALWQGLGYYSRARNLKKGAQFIQAAHGRQFPQTYTEWLRVPGCGPYTAAVVSSICFGERVPCVDGNVIRVYSRLTSTGDEIWQSVFREFLARELKPFVPEDSPGDFNQALMELGATVCKPRQPQCPSCPLSNACASFAEGTVTLYPPPKPRKQKREVSLWAMVLIDEKANTVALTERSTGFLARTLGFPLLQPDQLSVGARTRGGADDRLELHPRLLKHTITHHSLQVTAACFRGSQQEAAKVLGIDLSALTGNETVWTPRERVSQSLASSLDRKVWSVLQ